MPAPATEITTTSAWGSGWQRVRQVRVVHLIAGRVSLRFRPDIRLEPAVDELLLLGPGWRELVVETGSTWRWLVLPHGPYPPAIWQRLNLPPRERNLLVAIIGLLCAVDRPAYVASALALAGELASAGLPGTAMDARISALIESVSTDPGRFRSVAALERTSGLSSAHLRRLFLTDLGVPPRRWLQRIRMRRAREMIAGWGLSVQDVATQLGFADHRAFGRQFRAEFGLPPSRLLLTPPG